MDILNILETAGNISFLGFNHWIYLVIFFAALLEAVPLLGLFVPGMTVVIIGGFMVRMDILSIGYVIIIASVAAIVGDLIGYLLGRKFGESLLEKYGKFFFFRKEQYDKTKALINNHTGKSIIIGRFHSLTRAFAPFISGSTDVPFKQFMLYNTIGGILWATSFVVVGFIFGQSYESVSGYIGKFVTVAFIVSLGIVYLYGFINKRKHIFSKSDLYILSINIFSLYVFSKVIADVLDEEVIIRLDVWVNQTITTWWSPNINEVFIFITNIASPIHLSLLSALLAVMFFIKRRWYYLVFLTMGMGGGMLLDTAIKLLIHRDRPLHQLIEASGYSFPSGHTTMAIIFFLIVLFACKDDIKNKIIRTIFIVLSVTALLLIGFSRVYLNVHWLSDVIAGFALGAFWVTTLVLVFKFVAAFVPSVLNRLKIVLSIR